MTDSAPTTDPVKPRRIQNTIEASLNKVGLSLVDDVRKAYKFVSIYGIVILGALPDLYNLAIENHLFEGSAAPERLSHLINFVAFATAAGRLIQRKKAQ